MVTFHPAECHGPKGSCSPSCAGIEAQVHRAVGIEAGEMPARHTVDRCEMPAMANHSTAVARDVANLPQTKDRVRCDHPGKAGIQRPIRIEPNEGAFPAGPGARDEHLAIRLNANLMNDGVGARHNVLRIEARIEAAVRVEPSQIRAGDAVDVRESAADPDLAVLLHGDVFNTQIEIAFEAAVEGAIHAASGLIRTMRGCGWAL